MKQAFSSNDYGGPPNKLRVKVVHGEKQVC